MMALRTPMSIFHKFLIDSNLRVLNFDLSFDPISGPFSDHFVSNVLSIEKDCIYRLFDSGIISKTCKIEIGGEKTIYLSNYWDILQASVSFSLMEVAVPVEYAVDLAIEFCDLLAYIRESSEDLQPLRLEDLIEILQSEILSGSQFLPQSLGQVSNFCLAAKVSIDLINAHAKICKDMLMFPRLQGPI